MTRRFGVAIVAIVLVMNAALIGQNPAPQPASENDLLARYAVDLAAEQREVAPISLDADGSGKHGVAYDVFTLAHLFARVARSKSTPYNPEKPPDLLSKRLIIVVPPLECGTSRVLPVDVDIEVGTRPVLKFQPFTAADFVKWLPSVTVAPGTLGVMFNASVIRAGQVVRVHYKAAACPGTTTTVSLPVTTSDPHPLGAPVLQMPEGETAPADPVTLHIDGVLGLDGKLRYSTSRQATTTVAKAALASAANLKFEPARINGSPTPWTAGVIVTFATK